MTQTPPERDAAALTPASPVDESDVATLVRLAETDDGLPTALARLQALPQSLLLETLAQLSRIREPAAAALLLGVSESAGDRRVRKEARRALHRVRDRGVHLPVRSARPPAQLPSAGKYEIRETRASFADGVGSRALWLLAQRHDGSGLMAVLILNDLVGVKACDAGPASPRQFRERADDWETQARMELIELPVDYARQLVGEALDLNRAAAFAVPTALARLESAV
ncbi:MAG: hypothetical protein IT307_11475, partial [Chloroflexi bacterium]|nr:hypothetical protein [Chloroflexota bacterium]